MDRLLMSLLLIILSLSVIRILGLLLVLRFTNHRLQTIIPDEPVIIDFLRFITFLHF